MRKGLKFDRCIFFGLPSRTWAPRVILVRSLLAALSQQESLHCETPMNDFFVHILSSHPAGGVSVL